MPVQNPFAINNIGNISQWDGTNLGPPSAYGTPPTGSVVPGVNASSAITELAATLGTLTAQSGANSIVSVSTIGMGVAGVVLSGTYGANTVVVFEYTQDGSIWVPVFGAPSLSATQMATVTLTANQTFPIDFGVYGSTNFRVRCTTYVSGTINVNIILSAANVEPAPTVAAIVTDGAGNSLGTMSAYGTSPGAVLAVPINANVTNTVMAMDSSTGLVGATAPSYASANGYANPQGLETAVSTFSPFPIQSDPLLLQVVDMLERILACLEATKKMSGSAFDNFERTEDHFHEMN
jgi:hypothetical protein